MELELLVAVSCPVLVELSFGLVQEWYVLLINAGPLRTAILVPLVGSTIKSKSVAMGKVTNWGHCGAINYGRKLLSLSPSDR